jgi:hypothetical protein
MHLGARARVQSGALYNANVLCLKVEQMQEESEAVTHKAPEQLPRFGP